MASLPELPNGTGAQFCRPPASVPGTVRLTRTIATAHAAPRVPRRIALVAVLALAAVTTHAVALAQQVNVDAGAEASQSQAESPAPPPSATVDPWPCYF